METLGCFTELYYLIIVFLLVLIYAVLKKAFAIRLLLFLGIVFTFVYSCSSPIDVYTEKDESETNKVSIVGASISTYKGFVNGNRYYYPCGNVDSVNKTWWMLLIKSLNYSFFQNYSWSGARVTDTFPVYPNLVSEVEALDETDLLLLVGGYNDSKYNVSVGQVDHSCPDDQLNCSLFSQAYEKYVRIALRKANTVCCVVLMGVSDPYANTIIEIAEHYSLLVIDLREIEPSITMIDYPHPSAEGMGAIAEYCYSKLREYI